MATPSGSQLRTMDPAISHSDLFEMVAISVLAPISWLLPQRFWDKASRFLSLAIADTRPGVTRRRVQRLRENLGPDPTDDDLRELRVRIMATYMEERFQILREYRPGGWRPNIHVHGRERLDRALQDGKGAILMVSPFSYADLISKKAMHEAGLDVHHLGAFSRGFSPNSCHVWNPTQFGMRTLSPLRTRIEDRFIKERIVIPRSGGLGYARKVDRCLRDNGIVSMRAGDVGHRTEEFPLLGGYIRLATGAPSLALSSGAALLPLFVTRRSRTTFDVHIESRIEPAAALVRHEAMSDMLHSYVEMLERYIREHPYLWSGWYRLRMVGPHIEAKGEAPAA